MPPSIGLVGCVPVWILCCLPDHFRPGWPGGRWIQAAFELGRREFDLRGVTPGTYTLVASLFKDGTYTTTRTLLDARNDVEDLTVTLNPGMQLQGVVRVENAGQPDLSSVRISLLPAGRGEMLTPLPNTRVNQDGTFTLSNVRRDSYNLAAFELPDGYYVKSIRLNSNEILDTSLDLTYGVAEPISILLAAGTGELAGVAQSAQQVSAGAFVALIPRDEKRQTQMQYYRTSTTDHYGRFAFRNVVPGAYDLFAWEDIDGDAYLDPDFMKPFQTFGQPVVVQGKSRTTVRLSSIPAELSQLK